MTFSELCLWQIAIWKMSNYDRLHCLHCLHCHHSDNHHHQLHHNNSHFHHCWNSRHAYNHHRGRGSLQGAFFVMLDQGTMCWIGNLVYFSKKSLWTAASWTQPRMSSCLILAFLTNVFVMGSQLWTVRGDLLKIIKEGQTGSLPVESHHSWFLFWPNWPGGGWGGCH